MQVPYDSMAALGIRMGEVASWQLVDVFRTILAASPDDRLVQGEGSLRLITGEPHPFGNFAVGPALMDASVAAEVAGPLAALGVPSAVLFPGESVPQDVLERLAPMGFERHGAMPAMAVDVRALPETSLAEGYEFVTIGERMGSDAWVDCLAVGYELPVGVAGLFGPNRVGDREDIRYYGAVKDGSVDSVSAVYLGEGVAGVYCVATREKARGRGLGAYLTAEPLRIALRDGFGVGVLQSSEMGYPIYKRLGFGEFGQVQMLVRMPG